MKKNASIESCNIEQANALLAYAEEKGRTWKAHLRADWYSASANVRGEYRAPLQQVRNTLGSEWLTKVTIEDLNRFAGK